MLMKIIIMITELLLASTIFVFLIVPTGREMIWPIWITIFRAIKFVITVILVLAFTKGTYVFDLIALAAVCISFSSATVQTSSCSMRNVNACPCLCHTILSRRFINGFSTFFNFIWIRSTKTYQPSAGSSSSLISRT